MSVKEVALRVLPEGAVSWVRDSLYRRNCRLRPEQYRGALEQWYRLTTGRDANLDDPRTLGEKIQWLKLWDSTPEKGRLADKYLVREWVTEKVGERYLMPLLGVWDSPDEIDFGVLPERFVLKCTHGSGWNVVVKDKSVLDVAETRRKLARWLSIREAMTGGFELHYEFCEPRVIAEGYMEDDSGGLRDYKFVCLNGEPQFVLAIQGRFTGEESGAYDARTWGPMPFAYGYRVGVPGDVPRPSCLDEMRSLAKRLAAGFPFARVDFYEVDDEVRFGEITFTGANGLSSFAPVCYDEFYGQRLSLPEKKPFKGVML